MKPKYDRNAIKREQWLLQVEAADPPDGRTCHCEHSGEICGKPATGWQAWFTTSRDNEQLNCRRPACAECVANHNGNPTRIPDHEYNAWFEYRGLLRQIQGDEDNLSEVLSQISDLKEEARHFEESLFEKNERRIELMELLYTDR